MKQNMKLSNGICCQGSQVKMNEITDGSTDMNQTTQTRREFLVGRAGIAAAHMAAPYLFTSATTKAAEATHGQITVAAIGVGGRGSDIGRQAAELGNMVACADVHLGNANKFAGRSSAASARSIRTTARCSTARTSRP